MPYLDHAATTPMRPEALEAMLPFLSGTFGNPSGQHAAARSARQRGLGDGVVTTAVEHHAVLHSVERLERDGFRVGIVPVDAGGVVDLDALASALDEHTAVVSVMLANNEVGTIQPLAEVAAVMAE